VETISYEVFKKIVSKEKYFKSWEYEKIVNLTESLKNGIYEKYVAKCKVFQRDNFTCQNIDGSDGKCRTCKNESHANNLTSHHVKFQKNGGKHTERNQVTVCAGSHRSYHRAKNPLVFSDNILLPAHIRGHTFQLDKPDGVNWKKVKAECKLLRKRLKSECGLKISWEDVAILLGWLNSNYEEDYE